MSSRKTLYLASPLFSLAERRENDLLCQVLERWCDVFLPQRDGELVPQLIQRGVSPAETYNIVFERDITAIKACDALVMNLDGRTIDEGASFELGFACALGKECVGYHTDVRVLLPWGINPMISAALHQTYACIESLENWAKSLSLRSEAKGPRLVK